MSKHVKLELANQQPMTRTRRDQWINQQAASLSNKWTGKYLRGQAEHEGDLGDVPVLVLLQELENEHLDALSYIAEIKRRIGRTVTKHED